MKHVAIRLFLYEATLLSARACHYCYLICCCTIASGTSFAVAPYFIQGSKKLWFETCNDGYENTGGLHSLWKRSERSSRFSFDGGNDDNVSINNENQNNNKGLNSNQEKMLTSDSQRKTCMIICDTDNNECNDEFRQIACDVASELFLPTVLHSELREVDSTKNSQKNSGAGYTHGLSIVPYQFENFYYSYALAINYFGAPVDAGKNRKTESDDDKNNKKSANANGTRRKGRQRTRKKSFKLMNPYFVDLFPPVSRGNLIGTRTTKGGSGSGGSDLLIKAVAPTRFSSESHDGAMVYDLTAGFGQDSLLIALGGARHVHMVERDPVVAALLQDALRRIHELASINITIDKSTTSQQVTNEILESGRINSIANKAMYLSNRLTLQVGEGIDVALQHAANSEKLNSMKNGYNNSCDNNITISDILPDVIYLDPMFPPRTKSASVKKNMQILHSLLDSQNKTKQNGEIPSTVGNSNVAGIETQRSSNTIEEEIKLLNAAYKAAKSRVVVKRPTSASPLGFIDNDDTDTDKFKFLKPSYVIRGSGNMRWDVYMKT